ESLKKFIFGQEAQITKQTEYILGAIVKNAQGEIETYKKNQMEGIDEEVREIVAKVAPDVLGKSINFDDHEDLVWKALEKAKREGLFVKGAILSKELAEASKVPTVAKKSSKKPKRKKK
ncbi:hypothetical protein HY024_00365, partial [Candidatus Curtissbacteria bacterium]|nr:hypothetical protein [Candidatus Curtissbacteria bacterium]